jgi:hypothetical protein
MSEIKAVTSVEDLFSTSIDDLADLASFETPPPGSYILELTMDVKKINEKDAVEASFVVVETVELANAEDKPVVAGTKFSIAYMIGNEFGLGNLKKFLKPFSEHYGQGNIGALLNELKGVTISALIKNRKDKNDPDKVYASISNITVA